MPKLEIEQALIIKSKNPEKVISQLKTIKKVGAWSLGYGIQESLTDTYYDCQGILAKSKFSLRVRETGDKTFVTIKGGNLTKVNNNKQQWRRELEVEWDFPVSPSAILEAFELEPVHRRSTNRTTRPIINYDHVADLMIDHVTYDIDTPVSIYEAEIELQPKTDHEELDKIIKALTKAVPELHPWQHSKKSMGNLLDLVLNINVDDNGVITSDSFDKIDSLLS